MVGKVAVFWQLDKAPAAVKEWGYRDHQHPVLYTAIVVVQVSEDDGLLVPTSADLHYYRDKRGN